jgi:hypothetical protein
MTIAAVLLRPGDDVSGNLLWPGELLADDLEFPTNRCCHFELNELPHMPFGHPKVAGALSTRPCQFGRMMTWHSLRSIVAKPDLPRWRSMTETGARDVPVDVGCSRA